MADKDYVGIYKPRKDIKGGAVAQVKIAKDRSCMFLEMARQTQPMDSPKPYDWENTRIAVKLGPTDIGKLLALFNSVLPPNPDPSKDDLELYHQNSKGNKVIKVKRQDRGFYLKASMKEGDKQESLAIPIAWDEAELVRIALDEGYRLMLGWKDQKSYTAKTD